MSSVTLINSFTVPAGLEDQFFELWKEVNAYMRQKPGYLGHRLHRSLAPDAPFGFVNEARWASMDHFNAAHDDGFRALVSRPEWSSFPPHPFVYEVIHEAGPSEP